MFQNLGKNQAANKLAKKTGVLMILRFKMSLLTIYVVTLLMPKPCSNIEGNFEKHKLFA